MVISSEAAKVAVVSTSNKQGQDMGRACRRASYYATAPAPILSPGRAPSVVSAPVESGRVVGPPLSPRSVVGFAIAAATEAASAAAAAAKSAEEAATAAKAASSAAAAAANAASTAASAAAQARSMGGGGKSGRQAVETCNGAAEVRAFFGSAQMQEGVHVGSVSSAVVKKAPSSCCDAFGSTRCGDGATLAPGVRVRIQGLTGRPELNGVQGTLLELDPSSERERWRVRLDDGLGECLRAEALVHSPEKGSTSHATTVGPTGGDILERFHRFVRTGERICIPDPVFQTDGLAAADASSRCAGTPLLAAAGCDKPFTSVCGGSETHEAPGSRESVSASLGPEELAPGRHVVLHGLTAKTDLNGVRGVLVGFDEATQRWEVALQNGSFKLLRGDNLGVMTAEADSSQTSLAYESDVVAGATLLPRRVNSGARMLGLREVEAAEGVVKMFYPANLEPLSATAEAF
mmetsp:Transcript_101952/g.287760  ORF Transcript_101952/g.287760 Transcript_101952/m.287760 type:complete len:463 (-) Transcript_101952:51-1439(-)